MRMSSAFFIQQVNYVRLQGEFLYSESPQLVYFLTFGALSIIAGFLTLFLPETLNVALPDTVVQAGDLGHCDRDGKRKRSSLLRAHRASTESMNEVGYGKSPEWVEVSYLIMHTHYRAEYVHIDVTPSG